MVQINLNISDEEYNKLNNFYIDNFGYELKTQLYSILHDELKRCKDASSDKPKPQPTPSINRDRKDYVLKITYPDGVRTTIKGPTYVECLELLREWSKTSFSPETRDDVLLRLKPSHLNYISKVKHGWRVNGPDSKSFGVYENFDDAMIVREFMINHDWDLKYQPKNIWGNDGYHQYNAHNHLLEIAKGDVEL